MNQHPEKNRSLNTGGQTGEGKYTGEASSPLRQGDGRGGEHVMTRMGGLLRRPELVGPPPDEVCWSCPKCGPVAPFCLPTGRWIKRSCECQIREKQLREQEEARQEWLREQALFTYGGWMDKKRVDKKTVQEMCSKTFDSYNAMYQQEGFRMAAAFARQPKGNLLFHGDYGVGKTHLEAAICNYIRQTAAQLAESVRQTMTSIFVSAPRFFMVYEETKRLGDQRHAHLLHQVVNTPLLIIDDIDKSRPTESRWETYWLIFDERYRARRPTVLSTNKREELASYIGSASLSRLSRGLVAAKMVGRDYRQHEV